MTKTKLSTMTEGLATLNKNQGIGKSDEVELRNKQEDSIGPSSSDTSSDSGYSDDAFYGSEDILIDVMRNMYLRNMHKATDYIINELDRLKTAPPELDNNADNVVNRDYLLRAYHTLSRANPNTIENRAKTEEDKANGEKGEIISFMATQLVMDEQIQQILEANKHLKPENFKSLQQEIADFKEVLDKKMFVQGPEIVIKQHNTDKLITGLRGELESILSHMTQKCIEVAQNNDGKILYTSDFKKLRNNFLVGNEEKSLGEVVGTINKKINKELDTDKGLFIKETLESFKQTVTTLREEFAKKLYIQKEVKKLIEKRVIQEFFSKVCIISPEENNQVSTNRDLEKQMARYTNIPEKLIEGILRKDNISELEQAISSEIIKRFTTGGDAKTWGILDENKMTAVNIVRTVGSINNLVKKAYKLGLVQEHVSKGQSDILASKAQVLGKHTQQTMNRRNNQVNNSKQPSM